MSKVAIQGNASGTGTFTIAAPNSNTDRTLTLPDEAGTVLTNSGYITADGTNLVLKADGANEDARIDSSGRFLLGTTTADIHNSSTEEGVELQEGRVHSNKSSGSAARFNRLTNDGPIVEFRKNGTTVGSIGCEAGDLTIGTGDTGLGFKDGGPWIGPWNMTTNAARDNAIDLGASGVRFDDIWATNGTIQTSDHNDKQDIEELTEAEQRVAVAAKALLRKFRWKDKVAEKGDDARIHFGIIAQDLQAAFEAEGLDAGRYAMFISSTWWEAEETYTDDESVEQTRINIYDTADEAPEGATERTRLGVRYPELLAFIIGAL